MLMYSYFTVKGINLPLSVFTVALTAFGFIYVNFTFLIQRPSLFNVSLLKSRKQMQNVPSSPKVNH
jgi:hypothetical protein